MKWIVIRSETWNVTNEVWTMNNEYEMSEREAKKWN